MHNQAEMALEIISGHNLIIKLLQCFNCSKSCLINIEVMIVNSAKLSKVGVKLLLACGKTYKEKVEERFVLLLGFESFPKSKMLLHILLISVIASTFWHLLWVISLGTFDQLDF